MREAHTVFTAAGIDYNQYFNRYKWHILDNYFLDTIASRKIIILKKTQRSHSDSLELRAIKNLSDILNTVSGKQKDSLRQLLNFKQQLETTGFDSTIIQTGHITDGASINTLKTHIWYGELAFHISFSLYNDKGEIWQRSHNITPEVCELDDDTDIDKPFYEITTIRKILLHGLQNLIPQLSIYNGKNSSDAYGIGPYVTAHIEHTDSVFTLSNAIDSAWKGRERELYYFNGTTVLFGESDYCGGDSYTVNIWDKRLNDFLVLWAGP
jgi:hypothetical protein